MPPRRPPGSAAGGPPWLLIVAIVAAIAGGLYWWQRGEAPGPAPGSAPPPASQADAAKPAEAQPPSTPAAEPPLAADAKVAGGPKHPLPEGAAKEGDPGLPELARSDEPILQALTGIAKRDQLGRFGNIGDFTRRFVVTVDSLPRELVPAQYSAVQRIPGALAVATEGGRMTLQPQNFQRYEAFVGFAESLGAKPMVAIYLRYYPLLQQEYRAMGFPDAHFHDRVIEAIDDMLAAPEPGGPIVLVQPKVHYKFEDPALESLSAGRKIMVRVGPQNAARLKKLLREIRAELVR